jgi:hypothetical protein
MRGAIPSLRNTPSWHGTQFKKKAQGQLYFYLLKVMLATMKNITQLTIRTLSHLHPVGFVF